jgi:hypothetical protein
MSTGLKEPTQTERLREKLFELVVAARDDNWTLQYILEELRMAWWEAAKQHMDAEHSELSKTFDKIQS